MKVADIEAALKRLGAKQLKDSDPELFKAELEGGPSIQFLSRTSQPSEQKDSDSPGDADGGPRDIADNLPPCHTQTTREPR